MKAWWEKLQIEAAFIRNRIMFAQYGDYNYGDDAAIQLERDRQFKWRTLNRTPLTHNGIDWINYDN